MTAVGVLGLGAVGARLARELLLTNEVERLVVHDAAASRVDGLVNLLGRRVEAAGHARLAREDIDVLVIASPCGTHVEAARRALRRGVSVVSVSDRVAEVRALLALDERAKRKEARLVVGAGFGPGLSCVLAAHAALAFDHVDEIHVAKDGTGGPACARQHHRALGSPSIDWREGSWQRRPGGSGRELVWFPSPVDGADCYRAALPDPLLLQPAFPDARRITARLSATRQDRFTAWLPMLSPPHPEGGVGAVRVEVRGRVDGRRVISVVGAAAQPSDASALVAASATRLVLAGTAGPPGASGLALTVAPRSFLLGLRTRGLHTVEFEGAGA